MKKLKSFQLPQQSQQQPTALSSHQMQSPSIEQSPEFEKENLCDLINPNEVNNMEAVIVAPELTDNPDIFNVVLQQQQQQEMNQNRPRQYGRRSNPIRISSLNIPESLNHAAAVSIFFFFYLLLFFCGFFSHMYASLLICEIFLFHSLTLYRELSLIIKNDQVVHQ